MSSTSLIGLFEDYDRNGSWGIEYERIRNESALNREFEFTAKHARNPENRNRNRYRDVSPYDHSRVVLKSGTNDYINASLVEAPQANRRYILTQGPLPNTSGHFWQMVWEQNSKAVLMLNRVIEKGTVKCSQYFPIGEEQGGQDAMIFNDVNIKVTYCGEQRASYYTVRTLEIEHLIEGAVRQVLQFHYTTWPDFGVPQSSAAFLNFLIAVRQSGALEADVGPAVIHCSAGIGRSGTFCLVDTCLVLIEQSRDPDSVDVRSVLLDMRKYRMGLIQTADQLRFSYMAIIEGARRIMEGTLYTMFEEEDITLNGSYHSEGLIADQGWEDSDSDDEPPPLPPRRIRPVEEANAVSSPSSEKEDEHFQNTGMEKKSDPTGDAPAEIRRRKREERLKSTADQIERMKRKQREHELRKQRRSWLKPICIGLVALAGGYLLYRYFIGY
ncbi:tyrosine-protein phosphatase non-receptor type 1 isoform X2 [Lingula anatina]|uniref:protein-tyrosine-phosphatase n=1 Tax=Lingula anatina TaxID=7574 RepID=A0A1S3HHP4_LINAN|nr:tyrosine-protein phosphatase non-receptor type 1 isoform X2 [Lingula anatina]|eukprot:XP_013385625.1 tyrosine-protein phosphatase non-receptor type 1 isoform X2 [Lingula anatina]